jgi:hypothetical protein
MSFTDADLLARLKALEAEWLNLAFDEQEQLAAELFGVAGKRIVFLFRTLTWARQSEHVAQFPHSQLAAFYSPMRPAPLD